MLIYRRVLRYYRPYLPQTILGLLLSLGGIGLNLLKPWPFKIIVDQIIPAFKGASQSLHVYSLTLRGFETPKLSVSQWVAVLCVALIVIQLIWSLLSWATTYIFVKIGLEALLKLRTDLYSHLQRLSLKYHDARRSRMAVARAVTRRRTPSTRPCLTLDGA